MVFSVSGKTECNKIQRRSSTSAHSKLNFSPTASLPTSLMKCYAKQLWNVKMLWNVKQMLDALILESVRESAVPLQCGFEAVRGQSSACHWVIHPETLRERERGVVEYSDMDTKQWVKSGSAVCDLVHSYVWECSMLRMQPFNRSWLEY